MLEVKPSATLQADSFWMAIWQSGALSIQEAERRAQGSQRLKEAYSSIPFHARKQLEIHNCGASFMRAV